MKGKQLAWLRSGEGAVSESRAMMLEAGARSSAWVLTWSDRNRLHPSKGKQQTILKDVLSDAAALLESQPNQLGLLDACRDGSGQLALPRVDGHR